MVRVLRKESALRVTCHHRRYDRLTGAAAGNTKWQKGTAFIGDILRECEEAKQVAAGVFGWVCVCGARTHL